ncbi:MAG TPA: cohesin domain-containing protein [Thermoanaerobaculia bacterium]
MSSAPRRPSAVLPGVLLVLLALALAACGGGGGGGGPTEPTPTPPPPPPPPGIVFTAQGAAGANTLFLANGAATTATNLFLEVRASQMTDLYGVAFDLAYPSAQLQFTRVTAGPLLSGGAVQAVASAPGTLVVGGTHLGSVPGATGSGVVMTLEFTAVAAGEGAFTFSRNSALDSRGDIIRGVSWLAGSVRVTR